MAKHDRRKTSGQPPDSRPVTIQVPLPVLGVVHGVREAFHGLCIATGLQVLEAMMEADRAVLCGPKGRHQVERPAWRGGSVESPVTLGGRQVEVPRLRVRSADGEVPLVSFQWAAVTDPLDEHTLAAVAAGVLVIGYFEGLSSERGIAWRVADSLSLRSFLDLDVTEAAPDHSTLSRTRRLIDVETHVAVFTWVLERLADAGLVRGKTVGLDATTLEANAAMRSIERRDTGESYEAFIRRLAEASGVETPTRADLARFDRSRKNKKTSNKEWQSPQDPDAKVAKMKDGRTHMAYKAEHGVDLDTGAIVSVTVQDASEGDSTSTRPSPGGVSDGRRGP